MTVEEFERAALFYDHTLTLEPHAVDALLGKARAQTYIGRSVEAIATLDLLLAERWFVGDARYWRALNESELERNDEAWTDIELAAKLLVNAEVPKLAGLIAYRRHELEISRAKFDESRTRNPRDCETGYYLARGFTTDVMRHLSAELAGRVVTGRDLTLGVAPKEAGKLLAKLVEKVAARFGVVVTEKFAAQAVPIVGAAAGATLNTMFTDYYQDMARGHFIVRRLELKYGEEVVRACYDRVAHGGALIEPTL